jgi:hypothetical protein
MPPSSTIDNMVYGSTVCVGSDVSRVTAMGMIAHTTTWRGLRYACACSGRGSPYLDLRITHVSRNAISQSRLKSRRDSLKNLFLISG